MTIFPQSADANGTARFDNLPAGNYSYTASSAGYQSVSGSFTVEPGLTRALEILLPTSMVSYKWSVTPTTVEDKYDIKLDMTFKTDVPAPTLVLDPPMLMLDMAAGQTVDTQIAITNKGLVAAQNVRLKWPESDPAVQITSPYGTIASIGAGQTVVVPVRIYLVHASCHHVQIGCLFGYFCAAGKWVEETINGVIDIVAGDSAECGIANSSGSGGTQFHDGGAGWSSTGVGGNLVTQVAVAQAQTITTGGCAISDDCYTVINGSRVALPDGTSCGSTANACRQGHCQSGQCIMSDNSAEANSKYAGKAYSSDVCPNMTQDPNNPPRHSEPNRCGTDGKPQDDTLPIYVPGPEPGAMHYCGTVSFADACTRHDYCWSTCGSDGMSCNIAFSGDLLEACGRFAGDCAIVCNTMVTLYTAGAGIGYAAGNFTKSQDRHCRCCSDTN